MKVGMISPDKDFADDTAVGLLTPILSMPRNFIRQYEPGPNDVQPRGILEDITRTPTRPSAKAEQSHEPARKTVPTGCIFAQTGRQQQQQQSGGGGCGSDMK